MPPPSGSSAIGHAYRVRRPTYRQLQILCISGRVLCRHLRCTNCRNGVSSGTRQTAQPYFQKRGMRAIEAALVWGKRAPCHTTFE